MMMSVARHLLESTLFASFTLLLVVLLRRQAASLRHMLLLAAVLKFAVPLEGLQTFGTLLRRWLPQRIEPFQIQLPILDIQRSQSLAQPLQDSTLLNVALAFWVGGTVVLLAIWIMALNKVGKASLNMAPDHIQALRQASRRLRVTKAVEIRTSTEARDPYLMGLFRPVLVIPESLPETLSAAEYEAILLHELAHAKRWDNLTRSLVHVLVCVFWFFPLLRWLERRIEGEAELACDELVLNAGVAATDYLQGICKVCQQFLLRPLAGRSHVNSFNLRNRMELIMSFSSPKRAVPFSSAFAVLPLLVIALAATATGFASSSNDASQTGTAAASNSCVIADQQFSQGTIVRLNNAKTLQMCTLSEGRPKWTATTEATRDQTKKVVNLSLPTPPPAVSCRETAPQGKLCTCDDLTYSPGAVVASARGSLVCPVSGGRWQSYKGKQTPWPPEPTPAVQ